MTTLRSKSVAGILFVAALSACATVKPPTLQVQRIGAGRLGLTGAALDVEFSLRNPNKETIRVERVEYELDINGQQLGRGYVSDPVSIPAFGEARVTSRFDLNFLRMPGAIKAVFDRDGARARARGHFYMRRLEETSLREVGFDSSAEIDRRNR